MVSGNRAVVPAGSYPLVELIDGPWSVEFGEKESAQTNHGSRKCYMFVR